MARLLLVIAATTLVSVEEASTAISSPDANFTPDFALSVSTTLPVFDPERVKELASTEETSAE
ncbi:MAG: hypothetical protein PUC40_01985 [Lachnospiraceae bacterium]|nr:hypothetical protein [Lachnospiraceae bacterium]